MDPARVYGYLALARGKLLDRVRTLTGSQYTRPFAIGVGSIARSLHHTRAAECSYVRRLGGNTEPLTGVPPEHDPELAEGGPLEFESLESLWSAQARETEATIAGVADWSAPRVYTTTWDGKPYRYRAAAADIFAQLAFHEVHHRAQVLQMLRQLGQEAPPELDYNALMWEPVEPGDA